jgi:hypothetical protein
MIKNSIAMTNPEQEVAYVNVFILSLPPLPSQKIVINNFLNTS